MLKHRYTKTITRLGLFKNVKCFDDIQQQIQNHSDNKKSQGDALEVFAEAYLKLGLHVQYQKVYPENAIPSLIAKKYKIPKRSINLPGIDGVMIDLSNQVYTYQVKFTTKVNHKLSWGLLKGAIAISTKTKGALVFTNAISIHDDIKSHGGFAITKPDLDQLTIQDLKRIEALIYKGKYEKREVYSLWPYQKDAFNDVIDAFSSEGCAQLIMACGTGKTLIGQRLIEEINGKITLVLVPSLQLLEQTVDEYIKQTAWKALPAIFVGSDSSIPRGYDLIQLDQKDLKYQITTDPKEIRNFIKLNFKNSIIFSTYHSCHVVGKALKNKTIDFAIFDEAHKTTGADGTFASFGLRDENIKINKRLFMTATPKKYARKSSKDSDISVNVMGDSSIYGEVAHYLSFYKAAKLGIICKYKLIISVIDSNDLDREKLEESQTIIKKEVINSKYLAKNLALRDAIQKVKAKKIITFNTTIDQADNLIKDGPLSIGNHLNGYDLYHVSSRQNVKDRKDILNEFRDAKLSLVSNASCLTEGVDIPAVDLVAFMSPKKSKVDIAQAAGRALRKPYGSDKQIGYMVVPIFVETKGDESLEDAFLNTNFETVRSVITAMMENDEMLEDEVKAIRRNKGVTGNYKTKRIEKYVDVIGSNINLNILEEAIKTRIIDSVTNVYDENWGKGIHYLKEYIKEHGNSWVPGLMKIGDFKFGSWVGTRRWAYGNKERVNSGIKINKISQKQINEFEEIDGWVWDIEKEKLEIVLEALMEYYNQFGDYGITSTTRLGQKTKRGTKPKIYHRHYEIVSYVMRMKRNYDVLEKVNYDHGKMPRGYKIDQFVIDGFESLPEWSWDNQLDIVWMAHFENFKSFKKNKGHILVKAKHDDEYPGLPRWVSKQRSKYKGNRLPEEHYDLLVAEGFNFNPFSTAYSINIKKLKLYNEKHGHCDVPQHVPKLGRFVAKVRTRYWDQINYPDKIRSNPLTEDDISELKEMGFNFRAPNVDEKLGIELMDDIASKKGGKCISKEYINNKKKLYFKCFKKEHPEFEMIPESLTRGRWCRLCYLDDIVLFKNYTIADMQDYAKAKGGKCLSEKYSGYSQKLNWECSEGHEWKDTPWQIIRNEKWCECNE